MTCPISKSMPKSSNPFSELSRDSDEEEGEDDVGVISQQEHEAARVAALEAKTAATEAAKLAKAAQAEDLLQTNTFSQVSIDFRTIMAKTGKPVLGSTDLMIELLEIFAKDPDRALHSTPPTYRNVDGRKLARWLANDAPTYVGTLPNQPVFNDLRKAIQGAANAIQKRNKFLEEAGKAAILDAEEEELDLPEEVRRGQTGFVGVYNRWGRYQIKVNPTDEFSSDEYYNTSEEAALARARAMKLTASVGT